MMTPRDADAELEMAREMYSAHAELVSKLKALMEEAETIWRRRLVERMRKFDLNEFADAIEAGDVQRLTR